NRIPKINDKITYQNYELTVIKIQHRTIQTVQLRILDDKE
ncbi:MAG TPA: hypothetical protein DCQ31_01935, partial [Bacteroidales bacterium]|nr:hypothetical protein [Bacteroidales bacterium]